MIRKRFKCVFQRFFSIGIVSYYVLTMKIIQNKSQIIYLAPILLHCVGRWRQVLETEIGIGGVFIPHFFKTLRQKINTLLGQYF